MFMIDYRRRLPHVRESRQPVFFTWRLHGSIPKNRNFSSRTLSSWEDFHAMDGIMDEAKCGPLYLRQFEIAQIMVDAIFYNSRELDHYALHAFAVMPNHLHLLVTPRVSIQTLMKSLKGITAKRANLWLGLTGEAFWQEETFDWRIRNNDEFLGVKAYIENNPVKARMVGAVSQYRWSSAWSGYTTTYEGVGCRSGDPPSIRLAQPV
jgi:REP element-mobilizing transposase RayT